MNVFEEELKAARLMMESTDPFTRGDALDLTLKAWHTLAKRYAKGDLPPDTMAHASTMAMSTVLDLHKPRRLLNPNVDDYVTAALSTNICTLISLHATKPKFLSLLAHDALWNFCADAVLQRLEGLLGVAGTSDVVKGHYLRALEALVRLDSAVSGSGGKSLGTARLTPFLVRAALDGSSSLMQRVAALDTVFLLDGGGAPHVCDESRACAISVLLARHASDTLVLQELWSERYNALVDRPCIMQVLMARFKAPATKAALRPAVLESLAAALNNKHVDAQQAADALATLLEQCDGVEGDPDDMEKCERPPDMLDALSAALREWPSAPRLLTLAFSPSTIASLGIVQSFVGDMAESALLERVLPALRRLMDKMGLGGVSGRRFEQEVIDVVREIARVFYLNRDRIPSAALGQATFGAVLQAMRHGYNETERFAALGANIVRCHTDAGSVGWLVRAFGSNVCHNRATQRMLHELATRLLGPAACDDLDEQPADPAIVRELLDALCANASAPALFLLADWAQRRQTSALITDPHMVNSILQTTKALAATWRNGTKPPLAQLEATHVLLVRLASQVVPEQAAALFEILLQVLLIVGRENQPPVPVAACDDDLMAQLVHRIPAHAPLSRAALAVAVECGGVRTRAALTAFCPLELLRDRSTRVRAAALRNIVARPDMLHGPHAAAIAESVFDAVALARTATGDQKVEEQDEHLTADHMLLVAAAPCAALLAACEPHLYLERSLALLAKAARVTAQSDPRNEPDPHVVASLDRIASCLGPAQIAMFCASGSSSLLSLVGAAERYSGVWKQRATQVVASGVMRKAKEGGSGEKIEKKTEKTDLGSYRLSKSAASFAKTMMDEEDPFEQAQRACADQRPMDAVRSLHQMRLADATLFEQKGRPLLKERVLPLLAALVLPRRVNGLFDPAALEEMAFFRAQDILEDVRALFPSQSEEVLQATARLADLRAAMVSHVAKRDGALPTRAWLSKNQLDDDPRLVALCREEAPMAAQGVLAEGLLMQAPAVPDDDPNDALPVWGDEGDRLQTEKRRMRVDYSMAL